VRSSGLVVIDLDMPHGARPGGNPEDEAPAGGTGTFAGLCQRHGEPYPPVTFGVDTPSGGCHLYFAAAGGRLRNSAGLLGSLVDVRADGGYVVAPGSRIGQRAYTVRNGGARVDAP
jgi:Bifunctional DNA primase/polymerase, N-terminal